MSVASVVKPGVGAPGVKWKECDICGMAYPETQVVHYRGKDYGVPCGDARDIIDLVRERQDGYDRNERNR